MEGGKKSDRERAVWLDFVESANHMRSKFKSCLTFIVKRKSFAPQITRKHVYVNQQRSLYDLLLIKQLYW